MQCPPLPHRRRGLRAVHWRGAARWLFVFACGLLLTLVAAGPARAATVSSQSAAIDSVAPQPGAPAAAESIPASHGDRTLDRLPVRDSNTPEPTDSRDLIDQDDERDDDDGGGDARCAAASQVSAEETLGLRSPSRPAGLSLSPDGSTLATPFLTDSVRRL